MKFVENQTTNAWLTGLSFALASIIKNLLVYRVDIDLPNMWYDLAIFILLFIVICVSIKLLLDKFQKNKKKEG